jgi:deoxycytidylate deaminase
MRRWNVMTAPYDDSLPVMVLRNDKATVPISAERVRRLRKHLIVTLRAVRKLKSPEHSVSPLQAEPEGFASRVARTACSLCKGWCCKNGDDHAFLDEATLARVRSARPALDVGAVLRLYVERVPEVGYENSCVFHGKQGCTLDRSLRSDVCNSYFCGGLQGYLTGDEVVTPTMIIAGVGDQMRTSPILMP